MSWEPVANDYVRDDQPSTYLRQRGYEEAACYSKPSIDLDDLSG